MAEARYDEYLVKTLTDNSQESSILLTLTRMRKSLGIVVWPIHQFMIT